MASSSSDTESNSYYSDDSEWNYIPGSYQIENPSTTDEDISEAQSSSNRIQDIGLYIIEPIANEEWLDKYREKKQSYDERLKELQRRLDGTEELSTWFSQQFG